MRSKSAALMRSIPNRLNALVVQGIKSEGRATWNAPDALIRYDQF